MSVYRNERGGMLRSVQIVAALYSLLFFFLISSGYYLLFQQNLLLALSAGIVFPLLAWWLAKVVGCSPGGIRAQLPLFILLLLISSVGVFNSLMLNLEGRRIFVETIDDSYDRFDHLRIRAIGELSKGGSNSTTAHMQRVEDLKAALFSEIRNPLNCGQGPEARKILASLQDELPQFRPLSTTHVDCSQNSKVVDDYNARIDQLVENASWSNQAITKVVKDSDAAKKELQELGKVAGDSFAPRLLGEVNPQLEVKSSQYRDLYDRLPKDDDANSGLPNHLELRSVESLGQWSQLIYLIINRFDKPTTYIYLLLAGFADWMMVHLFSLVRANRPRRVDGGAAGSEIGRGFA